MIMKRLSTRIRKTKDQFILDANSVHSNKYNYCNVNYINNKTKVCIICPKHGVFEQVASNHYNGQSCPKCILKSQSKLLDKLQEVFPDEIFV